jgi:hypothetical protein
MASRLRTCRSLVGAARIEVTPTDTASAIDEIPSQPRGHPARSVPPYPRGELRHRNRIDRGDLAALRALGARTDATVTRSSSMARLRPRQCREPGDHRLALTFAIAGLAAAGRTTIGRPESVAVSYPTFFADLERIRS